LQVKRHSIERAQAGQTTEGCYRCRKKQAKIDSRKRNEVEGAFGVTKRRYGLSLVMAKLQETSETVINLQFLVMNLERRLRLLFVLLSKSMLSRFRTLFSRVCGHLLPSAA